MIKALKIPKVPLIDPSYDPSDEELSAVMQEMGRSAARKRDIAKNSYRDNLMRAIKGVTDAQHTRLRDRKSMPVDDRI